MKNLSRVYREVLKWVMNYLNDFLKGCYNYKNSYQEKYVLEGYVDANYIGNMDTIKSFFDFLFTLLGHILV